MWNGIGATGILLLAVLALLLFGPNKLPELGRAFGRTLREFKAGARDLMDDDKDKSRDSASRVDITNEAGADEASRTDSKRLPE